MEESMSRAQFIPTCRNPLEIVKNAFVGRARLSSARRKPVAGRAKDAKAATEEEEFDGAFLSLISRPSLDILRIESSRRAESRSENGARLCRRPAAAHGKLLNALRNQDLLRLVEDDTAALRDSQKSTEDRRALPLQFSTVVRMFSQQLATPLQTTLL
jgi:hypothetical protein